MSETIGQENEFSWDNENDIVVRSMDAIAVYPNAKGDIVIRQERRDYGDEDSIIIVPPSLVEQIVTALRKSADEVRK